MKRLQFHLNQAYQQLPYELRLFLLAVCLLTSISLLHSFLCRIAGMGLPYSAPYYFVPKDIFWDFQSFRDRFALFGKPEFFTRVRGEYLMYPAPLIFPIAVFFRFAHPIRAYFGFLILVVSIFGSAFFRALRQRGVSRPSAALLVLTTLLTSYPIIFLLQRGNFEVLVWIPVATGLFLAYRRHFSCAGVAFGLATSLKLYPFIFLGLLLSHKRYKALALGFLTAGLTTVTALWILGPSIAQAYRWNSTQLGAFGKYFAASDWALGYDHSFFALLKALTLHYQADFTPFVRPYTFAMACLGLAIYFGRLWRLPLLNQIMALSILSITIPPVSYDYTLLSLYPAFVIICLQTFRCDLSGKMRDVLRVNLLLFAIIFTPESYVIIGGARYGAQLRCFSLITMLVISMVVPIHTFSPLDDPERTTHLELDNSNKGLFASRSSESRKLA